MKKWFTIVVLLIPVCTIGQKHYNVNFDSNYISAIMHENIIINGSIYGIGGAICSTGECAYLSKYDLSGGLKWTREYSKLEINRSQVAHYQQDKIYITGRATDSIASKTLVVDTLGVILNEWYYGVEGTEVNFSKEVYYEDDFYYLITSERSEGQSYGALYKCDYFGNLVDRLVFQTLDFGIPLSVKPYQGNLLISINHRFEESCPFGLNGVSPGATYLAEVDKHSMSIIRDKKDVCFRSISNDIYISPTNEIIRTVILRDSLQNGTEGNLGLVFYNDQWEVSNIVEYPHNLAKGISNLKYTSDGSHYYLTIGENVPQIDGSGWPFGDLIIQKRTRDHHLVWEKRYYSHNKMKRLKAQNFVFSENGDLHIVGYIWPDFPFTSTFNFWLFSVDSDGCFNGNCADNVNLDVLVNVQDRELTQPNFHTYPNPVSNTLFLNMVLDKSALRIIDSQGKEVLQTFYSEHQGINVENLSSGVFFIIIENLPPKRFIKF